jgi:hypothetical protein
MALSLAIIWLTISANRSLNQASTEKGIGLEGLSQPKALLLLVI